jgi:hypothetical protein
VSKQFSEIQTFVDNHEDISEDVAAGLVVKAEQKIDEIEELRSADDKLATARQIVKDLNGAYTASVKYERAKIRFLLEKINEIQSGDLNPSSAVSA